MSTRFRGFSDLRELTRSRFWEFALFTGSTGSMQLGRFILTLAAARALSAGDFPGWALLLTATVFTPVLLLGVMNGMSRQVPYLIGARDGAGAAQVEVATWGMVGYAIVLIALGGAVAVAIGVDEPTAGATVLVLVMSLVFQVQQSALRARLQFNPASYQQFGMATLTLAVAGLLFLAGTTSYVALAAAYGGSLAIAVAAGILIRRPLLGGFSWPASRGLAAIGLPILVAGVLFSLLLTEDRLIATVVLGTGAAAPYLLASLTAASMLVVISTVSMQTYPRMALTYGQYGEVRSVYQMSRRQGWLALATCAPLAVLILVGAWFVLPRWLPEYREAFLPIAILLGGLILLSAFTGYGNFLNVIGAQWTYLRVQAASVVIAAGLILLGSLAAGTVGVAVGAALGYLSYGALLLRAAGRQAQARSQANMAGTYSMEDPG